jgi:hypothetical protein
MIDDQRFLCLQTIHDYLGVEIEHFIRHSVVSYEMHAIPFSPFAIEL